MKIKFIANACCIFEADGKTLLTDPWLVDGAFEGAWHHFPPLKTRPQDVANSDYLYISHLHPDHFDMETLKHFPKEIPIICLDHGLNLLIKILQRNGFTNLHPLKNGESKAFGPFYVTMYSPFSKHLYHESTIGNLIDSSIVVRAGNIQALNTNDNIPSLDAAASLVKTHGKFDLVQLNYNAAGPYPSCFNQLSESEQKLASARVIERNLKHMLNLVQVFKADHVMPFAGAYVLGGDQWRKNKVLGTTTWDYAAEYLIKNGMTSHALLMQEGDVFDLANNTRLTPHDYVPVDLIAMQNYIENVAAKTRYPHQLQTMPTEEELHTYFSKTMPNARANMMSAQKKLNSFADCNIYIRAGERYFHFNFSESKSEFLDLHSPLQQPYLVCEMDPRLMQRVLEREAHWNNVEIGTLVEFTRVPDHYLPDLHMLMSFFTLTLDEIKALRQASL